jgi:hypothetical protein
VTARERTAPQSASSDGSEQGDHREQQGEELSAEQVFEDAVELFGADDDGSPAEDADAPAPPG